MVDQPSDRTASDPAAFPSTPVEVDCPDKGRAGPRPTWLWPRWELYALLELLALCGLAVAQPVLDVIGKNPDFLLFHGAGATETLTLVAVFVVVPPVVLWLVGLCTRLAGRRIRRIAQAVLIGTVCVLFAIQIGKHTVPVRGVPLAALAGLIGIAAAFGYLRFTAFGQVLRVAAAGPLVFVLLFVFSSPASAVVLGSRSSGAAAAAAAGRETGPHPSMVVLILDEFPLMSLLDSAGRIDATRAPNFARLAADSIWYRNATAVSPHTTYAVPSMLTGRYPSETGVAHYSRYPKNLFTLLGGVYDIQAWETVTQLCPPRYCRQKDRGGLPVMVEESASLLGRMTSPYDSAEDPTASFREPTAADEAMGEAGPAGTGTEIQGSRIAENQPARFSEFLATLAPDTNRLERSGSTTGSTTGSGKEPAPSASGGGAGAKPVLRFLHLLIPHSPWLYLSTGTRYDGPDDVPFDGQWWARLAYQRHLQQVGYTDRLLGAALDQLERSGRYDDSLIVVTSDHGDSFSQGVSGRDMDPGQRAAAELAWVPLFVKEPGQHTGRVDDRNWQQVDLLPTLADYAGMEVPWQTEGISARQARREGAGKRFDQIPGTPTIVNTADHFPAVLRGPAARPTLPAMAELELVGRAVADFPVAADGPPVAVANGKEFASVNPNSGKIPALVNAALPEDRSRPAAGTPVAIAVNGRIGAVAQAATDHAGRLRVVGLVADERLFVPGANNLELYVVTEKGDGWDLHTCRPVD